MSARHRLRLAPSARTAHAAPRPSGPRERRGFTIVEAIVAIVMLTAGLLALVSSSAVVLNQMNAGSQQGIAAMIAADRIERLRSFDTCAEIVGGSATARGMKETWTVEPVVGAGGQPSQTVKYTVEYQAGRNKRTQQIITNIPCT